MSDNEDKRSEENSDLDNKIYENQGEIGTRASRRKNKKKKALKIVIIILIILVIIIGAVAGFVFSKLGKMKHEEINIENLSVNADMNDFRNIAILGLDSRYDTYDSDYRTDCIMIASINKKTNDIKLYSIYRDTYVRMELDGKQQLDKINHAYYGGVENTIKTINENLDLNIEEYIMADFNAVVDLVNAVDGVEINITSDELQYINKYIEDVTKVTGERSLNVTSAGKQKLNGVQALAYSRIRYTNGGDYKRTERMRTVLLKAAEKIKKLNTYELNSVVNELLPEIRTTLSSMDILSLIPTLLNANLNDSFGWPYETEGVQMNGDFYGPPNTLESNVKKLHQEVYSQPDYEPSDLVKEISAEIIEATGVGKE